MATAWHRGPMVAWDLESTGVDPTEARIVTACVAVIGTSPQPIIKTWLLNPGIDIPDEAAAVHGITTEEAFAHGQQPGIALPEIHGALQLAWGNGWPVVGHNIGGYDLTLLAAELDRHGLPALEVGPIVDTLCLDRMVDRYRRGKRTLVAACEHYKVRLDGAHDAEFDALAAARVAWRIAEQYPDKVQVPLEQLQQAQATSHADWAKQFQTYLRGKGGQPDAVIDTTWPVRQQPGTAVAA